MRRVHPREIAHHAAVAVLRRAEREPADGLQQHAPGEHQRVSDGAVGALAEISAFGVLIACSARDDADSHVGDFGIGQRPSVAALRKMRHPSVSKEIRSYVEFKEDDE